MRSKTVAELIDKRCKIYGYWRFVGIPDDFVVDELTDLIIECFASLLCPGEWVPSEKWKYVHYDDGDRGRYIHIDVPYDGGYGNYEGGHEKYRTPAYDPTGEYS
jgi:hypothetical protein